MDELNNLWGNFVSRKGARVLFILLGLALFASAIALADENSTSEDPSAYQYTRLNTTADVALYNEIHSGSNVSSYNYIDANGSVDVYVNGQNIYDETGQLKSYINSNQYSWSQDSSGIGMDDLIRALQRIAQYKSGETSYLSDRDRAILYYLETIYSADTQKYVANSLEPRDAALTAYHEAIQKNIYEIEMLYTTLEKTDPDVYCESRIEIARKYNLTNIKCGLHSKMCYNGNLNTIEDGRDFCVHTDNDIDYIPCINTFGRCGKVLSLSTQESEENSFIPVTLTYSNPGSMTISPSVRVELQKIDSNIVIASTEKQLGSLEQGQEKTLKVLLDTTNVTAGKYDLWVVVISGRKEILQRFDYTVLPEGSIERSGELHLDSIKPLETTGIEITGTYKNTQNQSYIADISADFYIGGKTESLESRENKVYVGPGETKEVRFTYSNNASGNYDVLVGVKGTGITKKSSFTIENMAEHSEASLNPTGNFLLTAPQIYTALLVAAILLAAFIAIKLAGRLYKGKSAMKKELV